MHTYEARNADCLQSLSKSMRPIAQTLREFVRMTAEEEGPQVHREAQEFELRVDDLDEALSEVEGKARPIPYERRRALPLTPKTAAATRTVASTKTAVATRTAKATLKLGNLQPDDCPVNLHL